MIETSVNEILDGRLRVQGYRIYAVLDQQGGCLYVGYTKNLRARFRRHLTDKSEWQEYFSLDKDLRVQVFDHDDVDQIALSRETDATPHTFADEKDWAKAAEWYMCDVLRPYINHRKTYKPLIDMAVKLARYGDLSQQTAYEAAIQVLHDWNVTAKRFDEEEKVIRQRLRLDVPSTNV